MFINAFGEPVGILVLRMQDFDAIPGILMSAGGSRLRWCKRHVSFGGASLADDIAT